MPIALPIAFGAASLIGKLFGGRKKAQQEQRAYEDTQRQLGEYNKQYGDWQNQLKGFFGQGGAGNANLFGPQRQTSTSTTSESGTDVTNPFVTGEYAPLAGMLRKTYEGRLTKGSSLPIGYAERKAAAVNAANAGAAAAERNFAARRGISAADAMLGSPAEARRQGALLDIETELPLLNRQLQNEDLAAAQGLTQAFGRGERRDYSRRGTTTGEQVGPADLGAIMQYFGMLAPRQPTIVQRPQGTNVASTIGDVAGAALPFFMGGMGGGGSGAVQNIPSTGYNFGQLMGS